MGYGKDHKALLKYGLDICHLNKPTSKGHISLIQTKDCSNLGTLEILLQDLSYDIFKHT